MGEQLIPNSTQTPNILIDQLMPFLTGAEFKVLMYVVRRTFGFHKKLDKISYSQFIDGIKDREGNKLDYGAGVSRGKLSEVLTNMVAWDIFHFEKRGQYNAYGINLKIDIDQVVQKLNQFRNCTGTSSDTEPEVVQKLNTQKKGKKGNKDKEFSFQSNSMTDSFKKANSLDCLDVKNKTPREFLNAKRKKIGKPPIAKKKQTDKQKIFFEVDKLGSFYLDEAQRIHGTRPSFDYAKSGKNYKMAEKRLKEYGLEKCKEFITSHLMDDTELGFDFSICLSSYVINKNLLNKKKQNKWS